MKFTTTMTKIVIGISPVRQRSRSGGPRTASAPAYNEPEPEHPQPDAEQPQLRGIGQEEVVGRVLTIVAASTGSSGFAGSSRLPAFELGPAEPEHRPRRHHVERRPVEVLPDPRSCSWSRSAR